MAVAPKRKIVDYYEWDSLLPCPKSARAIGDEIRICALSAAIPAQVHTFSSYNSRSKWKEAAFYERNKLQVKVIHHFIETNQVPRTNRVYQAQ